MRYESRIFLSKKLTTKHKIKIIDVNTTKKKKKENQTSIGKQIHIFDCVIYQHK